MSKVTIVVLAVASMGFMMVTTAHADSFSGELVDLGCYLYKGEKATGEAHAICGQSCVEAGDPIGLLTSSRTLYVLMPNMDSPESFEKIKSMMHQQVTIAGDMQDRSGVKGISVKSVE